MSKWWNDSPLITLYHGTSSTLLEDIKKKGVQFPATDALEFASNVLREYLPEEKWNDKLRKKLKDLANARGGRFGGVIYTFNEYEPAAGYAKSYAKHGGEIAYEIWMSVMVVKHPRMKWQNMMKKPPLPPRFSKGEPIILKLRVPKEWCLLHHIGSFADLKQKATESWKKATVSDSKIFKGMSLEDFLEEYMKRMEIRINQPVPSSMIQKIIKVGPEIESLFFD